MNKQTKMGIAAASLIAISASAFAMKVLEGNDAKLPPHGAISLQQAIETAEQHIQGSIATRSAYDQGDNKTWLVEVELVTGKQVFDVQVDALKNAVISARAEPDVEEAESRD